MDLSRETPGVDVRLTSEPSGWRHIVLENDVLAAVVLPDKGADLYRLIYKPRDIDVLGKTPWGLKYPGVGVPSGFNSAASWLEVYPGGSQEIFPNGGDACTYKGADLGFHGEASMTSWQFAMAPDRGEARLWTRLARSPFVMRRTMRVEPARGVLVLEESITNESDEAMDYMWGHHPVFADALTGEACRIDHGARVIRADDRYDSPTNPMVPGLTYTWPAVERDGRHTDLSRFPSATAAQDAFGYLQEFESGWYGLTNTERGFGAGMVWGLDVFPYAWFWQEMSASRGYPWYRTMRVTAIEPFTSWPGHGLLEAIRYGTHRTLAPGATLSTTLRFVLYESTRGIRGINEDGTVVQR